MFHCLGSHIAQCNKVPSTFSVLSRHAHYLRCLSHHQTNISTSTTRTHQGSPKKQYNVTSSNVIITRSASRGQQEYKGHVSPAFKYGFFLIPAITFCLGVWQIRRREWKLDLLQKLAHRTRSEPRPFPDDAENVLLTSEWEYWPVKVTGEFDHSRELWVRPRSPAQDVEDPNREYSRSLNEGARTGANIITAFKVKDSDLRILINRGWVDQEIMDARARQEGQVTGEQTIAGIVRLPERKILFFDNDPENNMWFYRDQNRMASELKTSPVFLDLVEASSPEVEKSPLGGQTRISLYNEHLSYIFFWFSTCLISGLIWYKRSFPASKARSYLKRIPKR